MRIATPTECQNIDRASQQAPGLSEEILMENAGQAAAKWIQEHLLKEIKSPRVLLLAGPGHNGADGFVVARHIFSQLVSLDIMTVEESPRPLWKIQRERLPPGPRFLSFQPVKDQYDLVIDALFGIGLNKEIEGPLVECIYSLRRTRAVVVSLDTPSGLDSFRGLPRGGCVRADHTLTFGLAKTGFFINEGPRHCGHIHVLKIGFPEEIVQREAPGHFLLSAQWVRKHRPRFGPAANKARRGRSLLIAGSPEYPGAGVLAARAALRGGSGYVLLAQQDPPFLALENPDFLVRDLNRTSLKGLSFTAVGIGPGLGTGKFTRERIEELRAMNFSKVVVDADALTVCAREKLFPLPSTWICTPHAGELGRCLDVSHEEIEKDRFGWAERARERLGCAILLKGYHSVLAFAGKSVVIPTGNPALAKAGTGDVLTGLITAFMAQGLSGPSAALIATYLHGAVADDWVREGKDAASFTASDLIEGLPRTLARF